MKPIIDIYNPAVIASYADRPHVIEQALADLIIGGADPKWPDLEHELEARIELAVYEAWEDDEPAPQIFTMYQNGEIDIEAIVEEVCERLAGEVA